MKKTLAATFLLAASLLAPSASAAPQIHTNQTYIEDVTRESSLPLDDVKAMFGLVLNGLPDRVKVYPTENYYYFSFYHNGTRFAGNIRLDRKDRDEGKVNFAYYIDLTEWSDSDGAVFHGLLGHEDGVAVDRLEPLVYRVTFGEKSVVFELNDLSGVVPPPGALGPDEKFLGPIFDESAIRFFLIFNDRLNVFHYILDETVKVSDELLPTRQTHRILIGRRTGFAFYRDHRLDRKILIGVYETNSHVNNFYDGPFDQLPDNFIEGEELRDAILAVEPELRGKIDRFGGDPDGATRYLIGPYMYYQTEDELMIFHRCATDRKIPSDLYYACFVVNEGYDDEDWEDVPGPDGNTAKEEPGGKSNAVPGAGSKSGGQE